MSSMKLLFNDYFNKFWFHPKIIKLKQIFSIKKIAFKPYTEEFFKNIINDLSWNEADGGDIPINLIKESTFILPYLALPISW